MPPSHAHTHTEHTEHTQTTELSHRCNVGTPLLPVMMRQCDSDSTLQHNTVTTVHTLTFTHSHTLTVSVQNAAVRNLWQVCLLLHRTGIGASIMVRLESYRRLVVRGVNSLVNLSPAWPEGCRFGGYEVGVCRSWYIH